MADETEASRIPFPFPLPGEKTTTIDFTSIKRWAVNLQNLAVDAFIAVAKLARQANIHPSSLVT